MLKETPAYPIKRGKTNRNAMATRNPPLALSIGILIAAAALFAFFRMTPQSDLTGRRRRSMATASASPARKSGSRASMRPNCTRPAPCPVGRPPAAASRWPPCGGCSPAGSRPVSAESATAMAACWRSAGSGGSTWERPWSARGGRSPSAPTRRRRLKPDPAMPVSGPASSNVRAIGGRGTRSEPNGSKTKF